MIGSDIEIHGPYATQPALVKIGSWLLFAALLLLMEFIPISLFVAVCMAIGKPAPHWAGTVGSLAMAGAVTTLGAWINSRLLCWLLGRNLDFRTRFIFHSDTVFLSALAASVAASFQVWQEMFLLAVITGLVCMFSAWLMTLAGLAISKFRSAARQADQNSSEKWQG